MDWINSRSMGALRPVQDKPKRDEIVSKIVGKDISLTDPRLLSFLAEKKSQLGEDTSLTEALKGNKMQEELKEALK